ncbi:MAG: D-amino acid dehydrogenase [Parvibaculum sp.]
MRSEVTGSVTKPSPPTHSKTENPKRVTVIGAGLMGVATAYRLARDGHKVTVIDREPGPGLETSCANGGQMSAGEVAPWAGPGVPLRALKWLGRADAPLRLRLKWDRAQWKWIWRFWLRCTLTAQRDGATRNVGLALESRSALRRTLAELKAQGMPIAFDQREEGILRVYATEGEADHAYAEAALLTDHGLTQTRLSAQECVALEPALASAYQRGEIAGGVYCEGDQSGDAYKFTAALAEAAETLGVEFRYGETVAAMEREGTRITHVRTNRSRIASDIVVLAAGVMSPTLLGEIGQRLPVYPLKGYSVTLSVPDDGSAPNVSITDEVRRIVVSRLGDRLRAAGQAEVAGYDKTLEEDRAQSVLTALKELFPSLGEDVTPEFWCGLRPMTPDGVPVIGFVPGRDNLLLNTGHGTLGWTLALGSADLIADLIAGRKPAVDPAYFSIERF